MRIAQAMYFQSAALPSIRMSRPVGGLLTVCAGGLVIIFLGWGILNSFTASLAVALVR